MKEACSDSKHAKLLFQVGREDGTVDIESVWAVSVAEGYKIDNIPFYVKEIALNDVVSAVPDEDGALRFTGIIAASGHSTIRLWFAEEFHVQGVREHLLGMGCESELDLSRLVAVDVPESVSYEVVRAYLGAQEAAGVFEYEEACLGQR